MTEGVVEGVWFLLWVAPQRQRRYVEYMQEFCPEVEIYFPVYQKKYRPNGARRVASRVAPVFPGYIFGRTRGNIQRMVGRCTVSRFVRVGGRYATVNSHVIEGLRELERKGEIIKEVEKVCPYRIGIRVRAKLPVGDLVGVIVKMLGVHRVMLDVEKYRAVVPISCLEIMSNYVQPVRDAVHDGGM